MRVSMWFRLADIAAFGVAQASGVIMATHPKWALAMIGVFIASRSASLLLRPWRDGS